jgi:hypothetical protein
MSDAKASMMFDIVGRTNMEDAQNAPAKYASVNGAWPADLPPISDQEAMIAARRLYRMAFKRTFRGQVKITSGRRYNYIRNGVMYVNPGGHHFGGWRDLVHDLSHYAHRRLHPNHLPHSHSHAWIEREMIEHVVKSGWLEGKLKRVAKKPPPTADERTAARLVNLDDRIRRWETKRRRAETALAKLGRQRRRLERSRAA